MKPRNSGPPADPAGRVSGLRERKRLRTKLAVQAEALRLFAQKGYEQTTVDDIADAAAMSPRTFFRYFPTKEDVILWDEYDDLPFDVLWGERPDGDPLEWLISSVRAVVAELYQKDPELLLTRIKLSFTVPEVRARFLDQQFNVIGPHFAQLANAFGVPLDDLRLPVLLAALYGAMLVAVERWQRNDGREDLVQLFDETIAVLGTGLTDLHLAVAPAKRAARRA
jgi:AcrR family transcriptional regulator